MEIFSRKKKILKLLEGYLNELRGLRGTSDHIICRIGRGTTIGETDKLDILIEKVRCELPRIFVEDRAERHITALNQELLLSDWQQTPHENEYQAKIRILEKHILSVKHEYEKFGKGDRKSTKESWFVGGKADSNGISLGASKDKEYGG